MGSGVPLFSVCSQDIPSQACARPASSGTAFRGEHQLESARPVSRIHVSLVPDGLFSTTSPVAPSFLVEQELGARRQESEQPHPPQRPFDLGFLTLSFVFINISGCRHTSNPIPGWRTVRHSGSQSLLHDRRNEGSHLFSNISPEIELSPLFSARSPVAPRLRPMASLFFNDIPAWNVVFRSHRPGPLAGISKTK